MTDPRSGLLLFAHGARDPQWAQPFEAVAARCRAQRPSAPVVLAFLEFMSPGLLQAGQSLSEQGCTQVDIVPLFLGAGGHVRKDVPMLVAQLQAQHPQVQWTLRRTVGESPELIEAMATIALHSGSLPEVAVR